MKDIRTGNPFRFVLLFLTTITILTSCKETKSVTVAKKPNIILIYTDDMGIGDAAFSGGQTEKTPNLDKLASEGKVFTQYYTPAPVCSPSRVGVMTGMYHIRWGINTFLSSTRWNAETEQLDFLDSVAPTLAKVMKSAGYATAHYGKWHMGGGRNVDNAPQISAYGFDDYSSTWESPDPNPLLTSSNWIWAPTDSIKRWERTAYFVDKTLDFIKKNDGPTFVNLWPDDVHSPWVPSEQAQEGKREPEYFTLPNLKPVIREYDLQMGRLIDGLREMGELENTLIIFTSDNGPAPSFDHLRTNGLRGIKNSIYEGGVKMPMIVYWQEQVSRGTIDSTSVVSSIDLLPTLASISGGQVPDTYTLDGEDLTELFTTRKTGRKRERRLFFEYGRNGKFKRPDDKYDVSLQLGVRDGDWKLLTNVARDSVELYNLKNDPKEITDLTQEFPLKADSLSKAAVKWYKETDRSHIDLNKFKILKQ